MYRFIAAIAIVAMGCSSSEPGNSQGTTIVDADAIVMLLRHGDVGVSVFKYNTWIASSSSDCKGLRGELTDAEMSELEGYMGDAALQLLSKECSGDNYRLTIGIQPSVCWPVDQKSPGIDGLTKFYADKVAKLAAAPAGKCGDPQSVGESNWAKKRAAAGSGD